MRKVFLAVFMAIVIWLSLPPLLSSHIFPLYGFIEPTASAVYTSIAALFSSLAFAALVLTLWVQKNQLQVQTERGGAGLALRQSRH